MRPEPSPHAGAVVATLCARVTRANGAAATQRSFMPPPAYEGEFVHAAAAMRPCRRVGGDFYDYVDTGSAFHVLLGDACGKGTPAALHAALAQGLLNVEIETETGAATAIAHLNRSLCRREMGNRFITLFYGVMTRDHRFTYCNAGQCRPMLVQASRIRRLSVGGLPPGLFVDARYEEESLSIESGDTLVVFSDGVSEAARSRQEFGEGRILEIVTRYQDASAPTILERVMSGVREFTGTARQRDDMSGLVVRYLA